MLPGLQAGCLDELALMWKTQGSLLLFFFFLGALVMTNIV